MRERLEYSLNELCEITGASPSSLMKTINRNNVPFTRKGAECFFSLKSVKGIMDMHLARVRSDIKKINKKENAKRRVYKITTAPKYMDNARKITHLTIKLGATPDASEKVILRKEIAALIKESVTFCSKGVVGRVGIMA